MVDSKRTTVAIFGLGYVGLPLARSASNHHVVIGFDPNETLVDSLNHGTSHIDDISDDELKEMKIQGFWATADPNELRHASIFVICVPTPLSSGGGPDLSAVESAGRVISSVMQPGALVILESTTYPGTTDTVLRQILESSGLQAGTDFHLAFSPERIDPGNPRFSLTNTAKVVGGFTAVCTELAGHFYSSFVSEVVPASGLREAEMSKLLENTYRHVNIALMNEMLRFSNDLGINLWEVISLASTKPFGFQAFFPGPGVGGHCIPIDPNYLSHFVRAQTGYAFRLVELAQEINAQMPAYVVNRIQDLLNADGVALREARILLLGATYKANTADTRESPAFPITRMLMAQGATVIVCDPHVSEFVVDGESVPMQDLSTLNPSKFDCVLLLQGHTDFDLDSIAGSAQRLLDTRGLTNHPSAHRL